MPDVPLFGQAMAALDRLGQVALRDRIAIVDFAVSSAQARFHLVDVEKGEVTSLLTSHGSGSDPSHSGWLQSFSNRPGSNATCEGAFVTRDYYHGRHGLSQRLEGMDASNDKAMDRAIVLHAAWYAEPAMVAQHGKLGRSQGCFAFGEQGLATVFDHLGEGRMIFAGKSA